MFHVLKKFGQDSNSIFVGFGKAFEQYCQQVLRRCYPKPTSALFDQLSCGLAGTGNSGDQFEIDACLNYATELILFEIKGTWPREREFGPEDSKSLLHSLRRQYGVGEEGVKGIGQLARVTRSVSSGDWLGPKGEFLNVRSIMPVLVVHDSLLASPGFVRFVASEFDSLRAQHEELQLGEGREKMRIASPVVLTVEDLELLEVSLEHFSLRDVLFDYSAAIPDRGTSFRDFLASSPKYSGRIYGNCFLAGTAMKPLTLAMERLFGEHENG
jgi:hypothetical protein